MKRFLALAATRFVMASLFATGAVVASVIGNLNRLIATGNQAVVQPAFYAEVLCAIVAAILWTFIFRKDIRPVITILAIPLSWGLCYIADFGIAIDSDYWLFRHGEPVPADTNRGGP